MVAIILFVLAFTVYIAGCVLVRRRRKPPDARQFRTMDEVYEEMNSPSD